MTLRNDLLPSSATHLTVKEIAYTFEGHDAAAPPVKLYYFDLEGKGEDIRTALYHAGVNFVDVRMDRETFSTLKATDLLPFGQVPALLTADGKHLLVQTHAILRYISTLTETGATLYPRQDPLRAAEIDALLDQEFDALSALSVSTYPSRNGFTFMDGHTDYKMQVRKELNDHILPKQFSALEAISQKNNCVDEDGHFGPWLTGGVDPSLADFAWYHRLKFMGTGILDGIDSDIATRYPRLKALMDAFDSLPSIQEYRIKRNLALK